MELNNRKPLSLLISTALVAFSLPAAGQNSTAQGQQQMVVAANPHAVAAGAEILDAGGSALDAAIAVQVVLSMVEPQSSGIGGGAFLIHFDAPDPGNEPALMTYQGRERAPAAAFPARRCRRARCPEPAG